MNVTHKVALYQCGHTAHFSSTFPQKGDRVMCVRCRKDTVVLSIETEYRIKCEDCKYGRLYGTDINGALREAGRHAAQRSHAVTVRKGPKKVTTVGQSYRVVISELLCDVQHTDS